MARILCRNINELRDENLLTWSQRVVNLADASGVGVTGDAIRKQSTSESQFTKTNPPTSLVGTRFRYSLQRALPWVEAL
ncbi:hypothetical protein L1887_13344 [Cichorium endivia]|nr:hypothetical protein L1887_13344 [Cichorium endivia]